jgi:putative GTP pyrophosphokinase
MINIGPNEEGIIQEISTRISLVLDSVGLFHRVFYRIKKKTSIEKKLSKKLASYKEEKKSMQDVFGIRATVYFSDDENIAIELIKSIFEELPEDHSIDMLDGDRFGPQRCNLIFRIPENLTKSSSIFNHEYIDSTFEVQFRTVFSEGWHEIEHDLRYKCKEDWENEPQLSRHLNGQLATLESCDWGLGKIFDDLAYRKYKSSKWSSFFRNLMRIRFENESFSDEVINFLNLNKDIGKALLKKERNKLIKPISEITVKIPLLMDNVLFIVNRNVLKNQDLILLEPQLLKHLLDLQFKGI